VFVKALRSNSNELKTLLSLTKEPSDLAVVPVLACVACSDELFTLVVMPELKTMSDLLNDGRCNCLPAVVKKLVTVLCIVFFLQCIVACRQGYGMWPSCVFVWCLQIVQSWFKAGWVHGDLKPSNVGVDQSGNVYLFDFESSHCVATVQPERRGRITYTPHYAAPEVKSGDTAVLCPTADLYSLGVILQEVAVRGLLSESACWCRRTALILCGCVVLCWLPRPIGRATANTNRKCWLV
jgi:serine/threonine protein kinase